MTQRPIGLRDFDDLLTDRRLVKPNQLGSFVQWLRDSPELFIDYETTGLDPLAGHRAFMLAAFSPDRGAKVADFRLLGDAGIQALRDSLPHRTGDTIAFNIGFEATHSATLGFELGGTLYDPACAAYAINEARAEYSDYGPLSQKALGFHELGIDPIYAKAVRAWLLANTGQKEEKYDAVPVPLIFNYNIEDVEIGFKLHKHFKAQLERNGQIELVRVDSELGPIISRMHARGVAFDRSVAATLIESMGTSLVTEQRAAFEILGRQVDFNSHAKLMGILYGEFRLPMHPDIEKSGKVDDVVLEWIQTLDIPEKQKRFCSHVQNVRELSKLKDTYLLPWAYEWSTRDNAIHCDLNQQGARTRRFSCADPNLQNVPTRTELGRSVRQAFTSRPGFRTYSMDESQAEYRCFAHYCDNKQLLHGYKTDPTFDIHEAVAFMLGVARKIGKNLNFGILYGMGIDKLSRSLQCSKEKAKQLLDAYYAKIGGIKQLRQQIEQEIRIHGFVRDEFGGRRHLGNDESFKGLNSKMQMTVANLIRRAMVNADPIIRAAGGNMLLQIHDEIVFELPGEYPDHVETLKKIKLEAMEAMPKVFKVPFRSDCEMWGQSWFEVTEVNLAA